jgi:predicted ATPase
VALKVIALALAEDPEFRRRFRREARLAARIEHPAVVPIYAAGEHDGRLFLAMRFIAGVDLGGLLTDGPLAAERALGLLGQVADALDAAHARGYVHRDVKPANILVSGERAYLSDFGLALPARVGRQLTRSGLQGTPAYMPPEQIRGAAIDGRADVYALGGVLHHCLAGEPPFLADQGLDVLSAHLMRAPPRPSAVNAALPAALDAVIAKALSKDPQHRFATAGELLKATTDAVHGRLVAPSARNHLPASPPRLIGREHDLERVMSVFERDEGQLVTVTGPGGVGKTQLSIAVASALRQRFPDGAFFIALEAVARPEDVPTEIAEALGLTLRTEHSAIEAVIDQLRDRRMFLVLDNLEHLVDAAADIARLAEGAPEVRILATSQMPLRIARERVVRLLPLEVPDRAEAEPTALAAVPSVALLVQRIKASDPGFELTATNAPALAELCRWLQGMPLALELAAPRLAIVDASALLDRLQHTVDALGRGRRDAPARQRSVRAMLEWTCSLLGERERELLGELSVFVGGFTPSLAEHMRREDVLDELGMLREMWLVRGDAGGRLFLPPPVRAYAGELLIAGGREHDAHRRHGEALVAFADPLQRNWFRDVDITEQLEPEAENLQAALAWAGRHDTTLHARLVAAAAGWMNMTSRDALLRAEVEAALGRSHTPRLQADLLMAQACLAEIIPDPALADGAVLAWRELGDPVPHAQALFLRSKANLFDNGPAAVADAQTARAIAFELADRDLLDLADFALGYAFLSSGDPAAALEIADDLLERKKDQRRQRRLQPLVLRADALVADRPTEALACYAEAMPTLKQTTQRANLAFLIDGIATALAGLGRDSDAVTTEAIAQRQRRAWFLTMPASWEASLHAALAPAVERLGHSRHERCQAFALTMELAAAIDWVEQTAREAGAGNAPPARLGKVASR